jgi:hypothetical protein
MTLHSVYGRMPVPVQHAFATAYGLRQLRLRHTGSYRRFLGELEARQWWEAERLA